MYHLLTDALDPFPIGYVLLHVISSPCISEPRKLAHLDPTNDKYLDLTHSLS